MKKIIRLLLFLALAGHFRLLSQSSVLTDSSHLFNEKVCVAEARAKGMPEGELRGWVKFRKAMFYSASGSRPGFAAGAKLKGLTPGDTSACFNMNFSTL